MDKDSNPAISKPSEVGAPERTEIEITPAMIEAGATHLFEFDRDRGSEEETLIKIFRAMSRAMT
jgi:hypothetical protein